MNLFLVLRAHWFSVPGEKKKNNSVPSVSAKFRVRGVCASRNFCALLRFQADVRKVWLKCNILSLSVFLYFSLQAIPVPKTPGFPTQIVKGNRKYFHLMRKRNWTACIGTDVHVYFEGSVFLVFARAHRFAHWTRMRNREINHYALILKMPKKNIPTWISLKKITSGRINCNAGWVFLCKSTAYRWRTVWPLLFCLFRSSSMLLSGVLFRPSPLSQSNIFFRKLVSSRSTTSKKAVSLFAYSNRKTSKNALKRFNMALWSHFYLFYAYEVRTCSKF